MARRVDYYSEKGKKNFETRKKCQHFHVLM